MPGTIAIIGGGLSGTLVVLNLLRSAQKPLKILWFDRDNAFGRGLAYSTPYDYHVLNVRAAGMSLYSDDKDHFVNWLKRHHSQYSSQDFVPRKIFAEYTAHELSAMSAAHPHIRVRRIAEAVTDLSRHGGGYILTASQEHKANAVVLALGNFPPSHPRRADASLVSSAGYFQNPFDDKCLPAALRAGSVLVIGSGLTMIDILLGLHHHAYQGKVTVISTHGYLPQAHSTGGSVIPPYLEQHDALSLAGLLALVNKALKKARQEGCEPQSVVDQLRPRVQAFWQQFSLAEKKQFLRHLRHKWGVARHRAPSESMSVLHDMAGRGQLQVIKGRISALTGGESFSLCYEGPDGSHTLQVGCVINCTGPESDYEALQDGLVKNLLSKGYISADELHYGIRAGADGTIGEGLYTLGPPLKGVLWESTAVPEIRAQARDLALKIISN